MGQTTQPETDDQLRERVPRAPGESDQAYIARLDAARTERAAEVAEPVAEVDATAVDDINP